MSFDEAASALGRLETFDPNIFVDDDPARQRTCDFVLALATASNDLRDAWLARLLVGEIAPKPEFLTATLGLASGLAVSAMKVSASFVYELLELVGKKSSARVLRDPLFADLVRQMPPEIRESWASIVAAATGGKGDSQLQRALTLCRNKVAFHYDAEQIGKGFRSHFEREDKRAFISRGNAMREVRFYFADAAVERHMYLKGLDPNDGAFDSLVEDVVRATIGLVVGFIQLRGGAWRAAAPPKG